MAKDLRTFLAEYEHRYQEQVIHIDKEVSSKYEITAFMRAFERRRQYPVMIFHRVRNKRGDIAPWPVITNLCATRGRGNRRWLAFAFLRKARAASAAGEGRSVEP